MSDAGEEARSIRRNLDAERRRLDDIERALDLALAGDPSADLPAGSGTSSSYDQLTRENDQLRVELGWGEADIYDSLTPQARQELQEWRALYGTHATSSWSWDDLVVVGLAAVVGTVASCRDSAVDLVVRRQLSALSRTDLVLGWEKAGKGMPIDYMGPGFGGASHRGRSAGHDLGRPIEALGQIRDGVFRGKYWQDGEQHEFATAPGEFDPVDSLATALVVWLKHLGADFVTPKSLPLPGWTFLYEMDHEEIHDLAHHLYKGGVNLRSMGLTPTLSMLSTETLVRVHAHLCAHRATGSFALPAGAGRHLDEMLFAAHSTIGAACLCRTLYAALLAGEGPLALRHLNGPVLVRIGWLGAKVVMDRRSLARVEPQSWSQLLALYAQPWMLDEAQLIDEAALLP